MIHICHIDEIQDNQSKGFVIDGRHLFAVKKYNKIHLYLNQCPHLGIQLEMSADQFLDSSDSLIMCAMHGALFRIEDGLCISGPCVDQALTPVAFRIENDQIIIDKASLN